MSADLLHLTQRRPLCHLLAAPGHFGWQLTSLSAPAKSAGLAACSQVPALCCSVRKQMPTDPQQAAEFAQSKGQARKEGRTGVTFDDVAGLEPIVTELQRVSRGTLQSAKQCSSLCRPQQPASCCPADGVYAGDTFSRASPLRLRQ